MKHIHAELMMQYAQDAMETERPWERWQFRRVNYDIWTSCKQSPQWDCSCEYRRKIKTININGFDVPEPIREVPRVGTTYYYANTVAILYLNKPLTWAGNAVDMELLRRGVCHLTKEAAEIHAKALVSFTEQK